MGGMMPIFEGVLPIGPDGRKARVPVGWVAQCDNGEDHRGVYRPPGRTDHRVWWLETVESSMGQAPRRTQARHARGIEMVPISKMKSIFHQVS
jgi:hypothetical protein